MTFALIVILFVVPTITSLILFPLKGDEKNE